jgi:hypothetical protein
MQVTDSRTTIDRSDGSRIGRRVLPGLLSLSLALSACVDNPEATIDPAPSAQKVSYSGAQFEVWIVDQANSQGLPYGGQVTIYDGADLMGARADAATPDRIIDLSSETDALCFASTGAHPIRPHMLLFNTAHTHAVLSFVASGHVVIFDAAKRKPLSCLRSTAGYGGARQAHAAIPSPNGQFVLIANQNGKLLERINTSFETDWFVHDPAATLNLATCTTPNGAPCESPLLRPDNAPICAVIEEGSTLAFVTLRGGGLFVVDPTTSPMRIIGEYDRSVIHGNGCGGIQAGGGVFVNSGGATMANLSEFDVYRLPPRGYSSSNLPNTPEAKLVLSTDDLPHRDSHGMMATKGERYLWVADRGANLFEIIDVATGEHVNTVSLVGPLSADPTPDLVDISPMGNRLFVSLRGPTPLSGDPHVTTGTTPGLGIIQLEQNGRSGVLRSIVRMTNVDAGGVERADPHAVRVRRK